MLRPLTRHSARARFLLAALAVPAALLVACGTVPAPQTSSASPAATGAAVSPTAADSPTADESGPSDGRCDYTDSGKASRPVTLPSDVGFPTTGTVSFVMKLTEGDVTLKLNRTEAPCTVHSFESLVAQKYFDDTRCHRLVDSGIFVLQCGDPTATGSGGPGYTFPDETDGTETYPKGTVAMANAGPNTNGSQFFLVYAESSLPPDYTVFGTFDEKSFEVIAAIASQGQDGRYGASGGGVPNSPAKITSITKAG